MTKTMLIKWLESIQSKKLEILEKRRDDALAQHTSSIHDQIQIEGYTDRIFGLLSQADDLVTELYERVKNVNGLRIENGRYNSYQYKISGLLSHSNLKDSLMKSVVDDTTEIKTIYERYKKARDDVKTTYQTVIVNVKNMKDAKSGITYLESLGFDLSDLIEQGKHPTTALSAPVDSRYLMIGVQK